MMALGKIDDANVLFFIRFSILLRCIFDLNNMACLIRTPSQYTQSLLMDLNGPLRVRIN